MAHGTRLEANLRALAEAGSSGLAERLCLPVDAHHVTAGADGRLLLRVHETLLPLELSTAERQAAMASAGLGGGETGPIFLFGAGAGELVSEALASAAKRITVFEPDPWMLRLTLAHEDFRRPIAEGRLAFLLGGDLFAARATIADPAVRMVFHPVLGRVYRHERRWLDEKPRGPVALVCAGGLFVDDLADALGAEGYAVWVFAANRLALEELTHTVKCTQPTLLAAINHTEGLAEFCAGFGLPYLCWEIDPSLVRLEEVATPVPTTRIFTYRRAHVTDFERAGFPHAEYLPLATNPNRRTRATAPTEHEVANYRAPIAFVGASMRDRVAMLSDDFVAGYLAYQKGSGDDARAEARALLEDLLADQRRDFSRYVIPAHFERRAPGFFAASKQPGALDAEQVVGELAAGEKRRNYVASLGAFGVHVWGDRGWQGVDGGARYRGAAGHFVELNKVYAHAAINVDIGRLYQMDIVTMRVFDVLACGGFLLAEDGPALRELFEVGVHLDVYATRDELCDKAAYYLARPELAARIAQAGHAWVLARHTVQQRVRRMLAASGLSERGDRAERA